MTGWKLLALFLEKKGTELFYNIDFGQAPRNNYFKFYLSLLFSLQLVSSHVSCFKWCLKKQHFDVNKEQGENKIKFQLEKYNIHAAEERVERKRITREKMIRFRVVPGNKLYAVKHQKEHLEWLLKKYNFKETECILWIVSSV